MRPAYGKGTVMIAELLLGLLVYLIPAALFGPASLAAWMAPIAFCVAVETGASEILAFMVSLQNQRGRCLHKAATPSLLPIHAD